MITPVDWTEVGGLTLEPNARRAVTQEIGSAIVIAGPGAGKTELLAQRADFLLRTALCRYPNRILAIAFKTDAARTLATRVRTRSGFERSARLDSMTFHAFARRIIELFRPLLAGDDALVPGFKVGAKRLGDQQVAFKELVPLALKIIAVEPMVSRTVRMTYTHVFLDEFQDCTGEQYSLIQALFSGSDIGITAVGDTKQRIMGWAGALEGVFGTFSKQFQANSLTLFQNFRSAMRLRRIQNSMVRIMEPSAAVDTATLAGDDGVVDLVHAPTAEAEAASIAEQIAAWMADGLPANEIAILVPREPAFYCQPIIEALQTRGIAFRNEQDLQDLDSEPVARLVIDYLRCLCPKPAPDAYAALMFVLTGATHDNTSAQAWIRFLEDQRTALAASEPARQASAVRNAVQSLVERLGPANIMALSSEYSDIYYVETLLAALCDHLEALLAETGDLGAALGRFSAEGTIRIMTIHKCKGMEFEAVVMPATEEQTWWGNRDEERSSFFVGVSRAKTHLLVTHARERPKPNGYPRGWPASRRGLEEFLDFVRPEVGLGAPPPPAGTKQA